MTGKTLRLKNIFREDGRALIIALDHAAIAGAMEGLADPSRIVGEVTKAGADAILVTKGMLGKARDSVARGAGVILRISGGFTLLSNPDSFEDRVISNVETALKWGADAVAMTIKFGHPREGEFIEEASKIADLCDSWGMPLLVEVMPKGERAKKMGKGEAFSVSCRSAFELGADFIKTAYPGAAEEFRKMAKECPAPIVILGGEKVESHYELFRMVKESLDAGGAGVAMGRNVWGYDSPSRMVRALTLLIHKNATVEKASNALYED
ncbi:MAG: 2-amino-3,7-dideoxy-D-threo-hept-6-ulosonate synthase [Candidatus Eremiobacteraeota bacterium]|nr:2-amino-3,7-dideoxy-D-threo-hept-6-ulosonate synthase [Candidatus Eremiobacteraeota bacterium]